MLCPQVYRQMCPVAIVDCEEGTSGEEGTAGQLVIPSSQSSAPSAR